MAQSCYDENDINGSSTLGDGNIRYLSKVLWPHDAVLVEVSRLELTIYESQYKLSFMSLYATGIMIMCTRSDAIWRSVQQDECV